MAKRRIEDDSWKCDYCARYGYVGYEMDSGSMLCPVCAELFRKLEDDENLPYLLNPSDWRHGDFNDYKEY